MEFFSFFVPRFYLGTHFLRLCLAVFKRRQSLRICFPRQSLGTSKVHDVPLTN